MFKNISFKFSNIKKETPLFAKYFFRGILLFSTILSLWLPDTKLVNESLKREVINLLPALNFLVYHVSKMFGIKKKEIEISN